MNSPTKVVDVYPIMIKVRVNMISNVFLGRNTLISSVVAHSSHSQSSHHTAVCTSHVPLMWMRASDCGDAHTCEGAGDTGLSLRLKPTHTSCGAYVCVYPYPNKAHVTHVQYNCLCHLTIWHHADLTLLCQVKRWKRSHSTWQKSHMSHLSLPLSSDPFSTLYEETLWVKVHLVRTGVHLSCGE